ncbi:MAG: tetratricopeptide repeat protein [Spirosomaceae bacterium]|nr:tetratricopeptide repeat protein [Spirosomataceae bacterium]
MRKKLLLVPLLCLFMVSCSQFSNSITSKSWHNVNAKYNALWIAKVNYEFVTDTLFLVREENYAKVLPVFVQNDTLKNKIVSKEIEEVIQKASRVAERHSNSKYLDEAYNLIGNARILKGDFLNAAEVFKYVNSNGKNTFQKHAALISLMRVYIEQDDLETANEVSNVIKALKLKGENVTNYYLTKAYYHQKNNEELLTAAILDETLKLFRKSEQKARLYYLAGQIYDKNGRSDLATQRYLSVEKNKPNYDLSFNAQVNLLASQASSNGGRGNAISAYAKMLEDRKNKDLRDKIYFKMGTLEAEKKNYEKASSYFARSVIESKNNESKASAYFAIAEINYTNLANYEKAALYYDSTLINMKPTDLNYKPVAAKANSLNSFIRYKKAIALEDSLQKLGQMNPLALDKKLEEIILNREKERSKMIEMVNNKANPNSISLNLNNLQNRWELYDPVKISRGKSAFVQKWGSRPLADNWRRREQQAGSLSIKLERLTEEQIQAEEAKKLLANSQKSTIDNEKLTAEKALLLATIPIESYQIEASKMKQQEALFQLGKLYKLQFNEIENARLTFQELLIKFPDSPNAPEALYYLAIMAENQNSNPFKSALLTKFPESTFARRLERGAIEVTTGMESAAKTFYENLYELYSTGQYEQALANADVGLNKFQGTAIEDRIAFLKIYILAKGSDLLAYQKAVNDFVSAFSGSKLLPKVKALQESIASTK